MARLRALLIALGAAAVVVITRHGLHAARGRKTPGGILIRNVGAYDAFSRSLLGSFFTRIADEIAETAPENARILEVGCGPGHLSIRLAHRHELDLTGIDLDPAMIDLAEANAIHASGTSKASPSFEVGDVARLGKP